MRLSSVLVRSKLINRLSILYRMHKQCSATSDWEKRISYTLQRFVQETIANRIEHRFFLHPFSFYGFGNLFQFHRLLVMEIYNLVSSFLLAWINEEIEHDLAMTSIMLLKFALNSNDFDSFQKFLLDFVLCLIGIEKKILLTFRFIDHWIDRRFGWNRSSLDFHIELSD